MIPRRANEFLQDKMTYEFSFPAPGTATAPQRASGTITCVAKASLADTDYMTITDPLYGSGAAVLYEFDTAGDGVTGGRVQVDVSTDTTAATVAARLRTAILATQPQFDVTDNADGTLTLKYKIAGTIGNLIAMTENVTNAGFTVSANLSGGADDDTTGATAAHKLFTAQRDMVVDSVEFIVPAGLAGHASNYWELTVKKDSTAMATYSTDSDVAGQGTITANTPVNATVTVPAATAGQVISLALTKFASAANLPAGRMVLNYRYV